MKRFIFLLGLLAIPRVVFADSIQAIDREVLAIDKDLPNLAKTAEQDCSQDPCRATFSFWDSAGHIRKIIDNVGPANITGSTRTRFFKDCHLIMTRIAPNDPQAVKDPTKVGKYYFHNGTLLRVMSGDQIQKLTRDQFAFDERTMRVEAKNCTLR